MVRIFLKAEILPGTSIEEAIEAAKKVAEKLGVGIDFDFNGVLVTVSPWTDTKEKIKDYEFELKRMDIYNMR